MHRSVGGALAAVVAGRYAHHFFEQAREVVGVVVAQVAGDVADAQVADVQQVAGAADLEVLKRLHRRLPGEAFVFTNKVIARQGAGGGDQVVQGQPFVQAAARGCSRCRYVIACFIS